MLEHPLLTLLPKYITVMILFYLLSKALDFSTGLLKTWKNGGYKSATMRNGIIRWVGELLAITFVLSLDYALGLNYYLTGFTLALFLYKEAGSILENLGAIGVELPSVVTEKIEVLNKEERAEKDDTTNINR
ncbi:phage holin family protein [Bacillus sp. JJ722]|uniref:phage holin family protein n=1 Tax=Bacillus sp. JJ722 TaxID=3122973 RepID=UPI0030005DBA